MSDEQVQTEDVAAPQNEEAAPDPIKEAEAKLAALEAKLREEQASKTRMGYELGALRKLADEFIKPKEQSVKDPVDFFADPDKAVRQSIDDHPAIKEAALASAQMRQQAAVSIMKEQHPDYLEIVKDKGFQEWVSASPVRQSLLIAADRYDPVAANELFSNWKERQLFAKTKEAEQEVKETRSNNLRAAKVDTGTAATSQRKTYSRVDLARLKINDPDAYKALNVTELYAKGLVR